METIIIVATVIFIENIVVDERLGRWGKRDITKRLLIVFTRLVRRYLRSFGDHEPCERITHNLTEQILSLTKVSSIYTATIPSLDRLLGESERRAADTTKDFNDMFAQLTGEKMSLHASLRRIVDPDRLRPNSKSTISLEHSRKHLYHTFPLSATPSSLSLLPTNISFHSK